MVLVDAGGEYNMFSSDITRTWPVNGKFTPAQLDLYNTVLDVQKKCIEVHYYYLFSTLYLLSNIYSQLLLSSIIGISRLIVARRVVVRVGWAHEPVCAPPNVDTVHHRGPQEPGPHQAGPDLRRTCDAHCRPVPLPQQPPPYHSKPSSSFFVLRFRSSSNDSRTQVSRFYPHSIGHWLGMDVHDVHDVSTRVPFKPGMMATVEPGIYVSDDPDIPAE